MEITWLGHACFQLRGKNVTLVTDPFSPQQGTAQADLSRLSKVSIVTVSHNDSGHNNSAGLSGSPRVVRSPGEYEISDVLITGVASYHDNQRGQKRGKNTIYVIHLDDIAFCHLGDLGHTLQEEQLEAVADADVLFIPIGGGSTIDATQAAEVISQVEPRLVIPMHYDAASPEGASALSKFFREMSVEGLEAQSKLNVTRTNLPVEMQIAILAPRERV